VIFLSIPHFIFTRTNPDSFLKNGVEKTSKVLINDLRINDDTGTAQQDHPAVAMNKYGYAVICWQDMRSVPAPFTFRIYMQLVDAKGLPFKKNIEVSPLSANVSQGTPDVAMDDLGHFVVVWWDDRDGNGDIYGQMFAANATPIGSCFKVNDDITANNQRSPAIAMNGDGDFVICWYDWTNNIYAQRYSSDGTSQGSNFMVNSPAAQFCDSPDIDMKEDGSFIIAWQDDRNSSICNIYARWFDSNGVALGTDFLVNLDPIDNKSHLSPAVAVQEDGKFMICYDIWAVHRTVYAHLYNNDGSSLIDYIVIPESAALSDNCAPAVCATPNGGFSVVWESNQGGTYDIWGRNFNSAGDPMGAGTLLSDVSGDQKNPSLALDARGAGITVWEDYRNSNWDIYGFGLGPLAPLNPTTGTGFAGLVPLSWDHIYTYSSIDEYKIYRSTTPGGPYDPLATVDLSLRGVLGRQMRDYIDTDVTNGTTYYYKISAVVFGVESPKSIEVSATPSSAGHGIVSSFAATGTAPTIDGNIAADEWANATTVNIANPQALSPITLYVTNDNQYLYLAIDDPNDPILEPGNLLGITFDEDNNGMWDATGPSSEGLIATSSSTAAVFIGYWGTYPDALGADASVPAVGVTRAISAASGHVQYEIAFDLIISRLYIQPGATFGIAIMLDDPSNFYPYHYGYAAEWPLGALWEAAMPLGELTLAEATGIPMDKNTNDMPSSYFLNQNYPNPFNANTEIRFTLPEDQTVLITIYDIHGREVATLAHGRYKAGYHTLAWNGRDLHGNIVSSGIYLCRIQAGEFNAVKKMSLIR
jgi:hypothetical protein